MRIAWWLVVLLCLAGMWAASADEFDDLRVKWCDLLTGGTNLDLGDAVVQSRLAGIASTANAYWSSLNTSPSRTYLWSDAARTNQSEDITTSYNRLRAMALAWATRGCSLQTNAALGADIVSGLDWLYANRHNESRTEYDNWWDWEIGSPQSLNSTAALVYELLSPAQLANYLNAVDQFTPAATYTGANRTDTALVVAVRGILGRSAAKLANARDGLSPVFPYVTSGDGFYTDGSFIQHARHPYTGSYGSVLLDGVSKLMWLLNGSTWQVTDPARTNVFRWVYDSYEPVIYQGATMDNLRGRAISRQGSTDHAAGAGNLSSILQIAQFAPTNDALAFKRMLKYWIQADTFRNFTNNVPLNLLAATRALLADPTITPRGELTGHYQFHNMDRVVHLRPGFGFALSLSSSRIYTYESINSENLHGWFTGDGLTTLYNGDLGQFSGNFWATVDPYHLPGTTVDQTARVDGSGQGVTTGQSWVGGAALSRDFGVAGMSLDAQASSLVAKKSWFLFDNEIVCLGAGITCGSTDAVHTTVENRRLGSTATNQFIVDGLTQTTAPGWRGNFSGAQWCWLAGAGGYYFPGGAGIAALREARTNSWYAINHQLPSPNLTNAVSDNYLTLWLDHGVAPANATYAYTLLPNFSAGQVAAYATAPDITVISNTGSLQAVRETTLGIVAANFWAAGTNTADFITVNQKAAVIVRESGETIEAGISDPTQINPGSIDVTLDRAATWLVSADAGVVVEQLAPQIRFSVAVNGARGRSFHVKFSTDPANPNPTWDADPTNDGAQDGGGVWNGTAVNWWNGVTNVAWNDAAAPMATFGNGGSAGLVTVSGAHAVGALVFGAVTNGGYTLTGTGPLTLGSGITANANATLDVPLVLAGDQQWTAPAGTTLSVAKNISAGLPVVMTLGGAGEFAFTGGAGQWPANLDNLHLAGDVTVFLDAGLQTTAQLTLDDGVSATVTGAGVLSVSGPADTRIGGITAGAAQRLDLSGLGVFTSSASASTFSVGGQTGTVAGTGELRLATNSVITARTFAVQNVTGSTSAQSQGVVYLGRTTTINADSGVVGLVRDNGVIRFPDGTVNPALTMRGSDGVSPAADWKIGSRSSSYFNSNTGLVDLVSGVLGASTLDANVGTLTLADESYCLTTTRVLNGSFRMGGGMLNVSNLVLGLKSSVNTQSLGIVNATFSQTNGGMVKVRTLSLGERQPANTGTLNATYQLDGGASLRAQNILAGNGTANRVFNWNDGTLANFDPATDLTVGAGLMLTLAAGGVHHLSVDAGRVGTLNAGLNGPGGFSKTGDGVAVLNGVNDFAGPLAVSAGRVLINGVFNGTGTVSVASGATLGGTGVIAGPVIVNGTLSPGVALGALTISNGLNLAGNLLIELDKNASPANDTVSVTGTLTNSGSGVVTMVNLGTNALLAGDRFYVFNQPLLNGDVLSVASDGGVVWSNRLAVDGSLEVLRVVNLDPTQLAATAASGELELSWPADHVGWRLLTQTNRLEQGLSLDLHDWGTVAGSLVTNHVSIPLENWPAGFYRLVYP